MFVQAAHDGATGLGRHWNATARSVDRRRPTCAQRRARKPCHSGRPGRRHRRAARPAPHVRRQRAPGTVRAQRLVASHGRGARAPARHGGASARRPDERTRRDRARDLAARWRQARTPCCPRWRGRRSSTPAAATSSPVCATPSRTSPRRRACRAWSTPTPSRSGAAAPSSTPTCCAKPGSRPGAVRRRRRGQGHLRRLSQPRWAAWFATEPAQRHTPRVFAVCRWAGSAHRCRMPPAGRHTHDQVKVDPRHRWIVG
jgi:hypothetical protein